MSNLLSVDDQLAALLEEMLAQRDAGVLINLEEYVQRLPEQEAEIRSLWATAQFAGFFAGTLSSHATGQTDQVQGIPERDNIPQQLSGDYQIIRELGTGGMGVVYLARQRSLGRLVALKMMRDNRLSSPTDRARFRAEAAAVAQLKHPNIVTVFEVGEHQDIPWIVMEYVDGVTLGKRLTHGPLPQREAARIVSMIAKALQHAHEIGILHRDLKPNNILLPVLTQTEDSSTSPTSSEVQSIKIVDFGLAKQLSVTEGTTQWRTQTGAIVGTPGYMSPEQAQGKRELTAAADIYALGAILYECLTGRPPFQAATPIDALLMVLEQEPVPPRLLTSGIDRELELICMKCLQKIPTHRYPTAAALANDLDAYLTGEALSSRPSGVRYFLMRLFSETHHVDVLKNWGLLWIWHSLATFLLCLLTQVMYWQNIRSHSAYLILWTVGLVTWGTILWKLRRRAGPVLFVERQIAHAWAAGVCASIGMFIIEVLEKAPVLSLSPAMAISAGMVFVFKAGILSGRFYVTAITMFATAAVMPLFPNFNILLFGISTALCFLIPGLKYYRIQRNLPKLALRSG